MISISSKIVMPDIKKLERSLKVKSLRERELLASVTKEVRLGFDPKFSYRIVDFKEKPISVLIDESKDLKNVLKGSSSGFVVICTIGNFLKELSTKYRERGDIVSDLYLDRIGSDTVENLAEASSSYLLNKFYSAEEYELTRRYSPGYGDLNLKNQRIIFDLFKDIEIDVRLNESCYMDPEKSISYIVGVKNKG